ncbi:hypothetical protein HDU96_006242 [Phlyctochytrium bullatum]|nr:hypothetical protein HDU96_006242 [Phlyctochytrium bullatum]
MASDFSIASITQTHLPQSIHVYATHYATEAHGLANAGSTDGEPQKRKRGRPPKPKEDHEAPTDEAVHMHMSHEPQVPQVLPVTNDITSSEEPKKKRGRGRPPKERTPEELAKHLAAKAAKEARKLLGGEKRGRGRPRKTPVDPSATMNGNIQPPSLQPASVQLPNGIPNGQTLIVQPPPNGTLFPSYYSQVAPSSTQQLQQQHPTLQQASDPSINGVKRGRGRPPKDKSQ